MNENGTGNLVNLVNVAVAGAAVKEYEYNCVGRAGSGFRPSLAVVGIVPSALIFILVSSKSVAGVPFTSVSVNPGYRATSPPEAALSASLLGPIRRNALVVVS